MDRLYDGKTAEDIVRYLDSVQFPAKKDILVHAARRNSAPNDIVASLERLPKPQFNSFEELLAAYPREDE